MLTNSVVYGVALPVVGNGKDSTRFWLSKFAATQDLHPPSEPDHEYRGQGYPPSKTSWKEFAVETDVFYLDMEELLKDDFGCKIVEFGDTWNRQYFFQAVEIANPQDEQREDLLVPVDLATIQSTDLGDADARIRRFCEAAKIEYTQPRWYVLREWNSD
jgi:hypothetical protein